MKNCKKITAAVLAALLALSVFICPAFAGGPFIDPSSETVTTTPETQNPEDLTYVPPTLPETETETQIHATGTNPEILEKVSFFQQILNRINEFFQMVLDFFKNLENIKKSFRKFADNTTKTIIYNGDDKNTVDALKGITGKKLISVGKSKSNEWVAENINVPGGFCSSYDAYRNGEFIAKIELSVPGEHNIINSLCAVAAAVESGADIDAVCRGLKNFRGAARRFELLGTYKGITFADDYAHHPAEIRVTLEAAKKMGYKRVWAVHQPFTFTRTEKFLNEFADVLKLADRCVISAIMGSREINKTGIKAADLAQLVPDSVQLDTFEEICDYVTENAAEGDIVITLGCGDIYKAARMMVNRLSD